MRIASAVATELDECGLGLRLRYLNDGISDDARVLGDTVLPERSGYYVGARMVEDAISSRGLPWTVLASAEEICEASRLTGVAAGG